MLDTCRMPTMIEVRNVPEATHRRLKARAAMEGVSISQYVMSAIERALEQPGRLVGADGGIASGKRLAADDRYTAARLLERIDQVDLSEDAIAGIEAVVRERELDRPEAVTLDGNPCS